MKLSVFTCLLGSMPFEEALDYLQKSGVTAIELATGGYVGKKHADPCELLSDKTKMNRFKETIKSHGMEVVGVSCHANPVHPDEEAADRFREELEKSVQLASELGVSRIITFSGCPGDAPGSRYPNWVTCPWPEDFLKILEYQWNEVLIPYWIRMGEFCKSYGVDKVCLEMHPGFCVYNTDTMLKLRAAAGETIGANFDPSHLFWQGMDPVAVIRKLGSAIHYVHAKDCRIDEGNSGINGVLDTRHYGDVIERSWVFRTVGYGHGYQVWKDIISNLRMVGYDYAVSIEHEDSLLSPNEGLQKAIAFLKEVIAFEDTGRMWWA